MIKLGLLRNSRQNYEEKSYSWFICLFLNLFTYSLTPQAFIEDLAWTKDCGACYWANLL